MKNKEAIATDKAKNPLSRIEKTPSRLSSRSPSVARRSLSLSSAPSTSNSELQSKSSNDNYSEIVENEEYSDDTGDSDDTENELKKENIWNFFDIRDNHYYCKFCQKVIDFKF